MRKVDHTGEKYGRLTFIRPAENTKWGESRWVMRCECGTEFITQTKQVLSGRTKSCGCYKRERCLEMVPAMRAKLKKMREDGTLKKSESKKDDIQKG